MQNQNQHVPPSSGDRIIGSPQNAPANEDLKKVVAHIEACSDQVLSTKTIAQETATEVAKLRAEQTAANAKIAALEQQRQAPANGAASRPNSGSTSVPRSRAWGCACAASIIALIAIASLVVAISAYREASRANAEVELLRDELHTVSERQQLMRRDWQRFLNNFTSAKGDTP